MAETIAYAQTFVKHPDKHDPIDVGLGARPDLEVGEVALKVHRQGRAHRTKARVHLPANRAAEVRFARSSGSKSAAGLISFRYSPIASVSQTLSPLWLRQGTRKEDDKSNSSARIAGSSGEMTISEKGSPENLVINQPRSAHEE